METENSALLVDTKHEVADRTDMHMNCYIAGRPVLSENVMEVKSPYDKRVVGSVSLANAKDVQHAIQQALEGKKKLSRFERYTILDKVRQLLTERKEEFAQTISAES